MRFPSSTLERGSAHQGVSPFIIYTYIYIHTHIYIMQTIPLAGQRSDLPSDPWPSTPPTPPASASPAPAAPFAAPTAAPRGRRPRSAARSAKPRWRWRRQGKDGVAGRWTAWTSASRQGLITAGKEKPGKILWKYMSSSVGMIIPNWIGKNHVPNHQSVKIWGFRLEMGKSCGSQLKLWPVIPRWMSKWLLWNIGILQNWTNKND